MFFFGVGVNLRFFDRSLICFFVSFLEDRFIIFKLQKQFLFVIFLDSFEVMFDLDCCIGFVLKKVFGCNLIYWCFYYYFYWYGYCYEFCDCFQCFGQSFFFVVDFFVDGYFELSFVVGFFFFVVVKFYCYYFDYQ